MQPEAAADAVLQTRAATVELRLRSRVRPKSPAVEERDQPEEHGMPKRTKRHKLRPHLRVPECLQLPVVSLRRDPSNPVEAADGVGAEPIVIPRQLVEGRVADERVPNEPRGNRHVLFSIWG